MLYPHSRLRQSPGAKRRVLPCLTIAFCEVLAIVNRPVAGGPDPAVTGAEPGTRSVNVAGWSLHKSRVGQKNQLQALQIPGCVAHGNGLRGATRRTEVYYTDGVIPALVNTLLRIGLNRKRISINCPAKLLLEGTGPASEKPIWIGAQPELSLATIGFDQ
ncbi:MAG: hypothetical protein R3B47_12220 [Bacteroidia bacterium]